MFRARTVQNVAIGVGLSWFNQLLQIAAKVVLARLLFPADFGVFALAAGLVSYTAVMRKLDRELFEGFWRNLGLALRRPLATPASADDP